jgi:hypothetical protein
MEFVRSLDTLGESWPAEPVVVVADGVLGTNSSMVVFDGVPLIAYRQVVYDDLMLIKAADPNGSAWLAPMRIDRRLRCGHGNSLAIVDGQPAISYNEIDSAKLIYARIVE